MAGRSLHALKQAFFSIAVAVGMVLLAGTGGIVYLYRDLPKIRTLADYVPWQSTKVYADDGALVGMFYQERRTAVAFSAIPPHVVQAFLAAEDAHFYAHEGIDYLGILRAAVKNLRPGAHLQGASTITQQTVKTLVLGPERSYIRKMREALLAHGLEKLLSKEDILTMYLNQIYFGSGAWGIEEAAQTYFGVSVGKLDLNQATLLAAIPKNPSRYTILSNPAAAKVRQKYVLEHMQSLGWADASAVNQALAAPIPSPAAPPPYLGQAPHYVEHVRRLLVEKYGEARVYQGGLTVYTGMVAQEQILAHAALRQAVEEVSRRQGYTGAPLRVEVDRFNRYLSMWHAVFESHVQSRHLPAASEAIHPEWIWDISALRDTDLGDEHRVRRILALAPLRPSQRVRAPVVRLDPLTHVAFVDLGSCWGRLRLEEMQWARRFNPLMATPPPRDPAEVLNRGDVITVDITHAKPSRLPTGETLVDIRLVPEPKLEGALVAIDPYSHVVRALVGGYGMEGSGFNRATQALRQAGSVFKPVVYAAALNNGAMTAASLCPDSPVVVADPWTGKLWKPENFEDGRYDGNITYRQALAHSKNTCSVRLIQKIGPQEVIAMARAMGISTPLPENLTLALGTADVTPLEMTNAYTTLVAGGWFAPPMLIRKVVDAQGHVLEENHPEPQQAMGSPAAYVLTSMLRSVVEEGTARRALGLGRAVIGKTGTSQEARNVWFVGASPRLVASVWMGFDNNSSLGRETGATAALPGWIRFMDAALDPQPSQDFPQPEDIVTVDVDPKTGQPSQEVGSIPEVFVPGTEPHPETQQLPSIFLEDPETSDPPSSEAF